uniref:Uncharacterized protein n=1 Tax=Pyrodinium bahamense TaxID=73915 RepID=A0A7S0FAH6_9DINO
MARLGHSRVQRPVACPCNEDEGGLMPVPPDATHDGVLASLAVHLWYAGDEVLTAGSFLGDSGWSNRGETPAALGAMGINLRSTADMILAGDWDDAVGQLEETAYAGEEYYAAEQYSGLLALLSDSEGYGDPNAPPEDWPAAAASLRSLAASTGEVAQRVAENEMAHDCLRRSAERLEAAAALFAQAGHRASARHC